MKYFQLQTLLIALSSFLLLTSTVLAQDVTIDEDDSDNPYLDPAAASEALQPTKRTDSVRAYMLGISYGLNPIIILAPAVSLGVYWDPFVIGTEISDSELFGIWEKERRENFGTSRFREETLFLKWFYGENFYLMAAREHRTINLYNRTFNRITGKALFDMHFETTVASLGAGLLRFNDIGFLAIDILRYNLTHKQSVKVVEYWETWSLLSGSRADLDANIKSRTDKWNDILKAPSGFVVTFGFYF
ncbi:MAG: hypothetical protein H8E38_02460 [SAR324 cluster bacterium]|nr:hypothetical protein [SAR324 cluster bacterium]MBL7034696.1 hypothetical protein [SAR324 cluster bacterium]